MSYSVDQAENVIRILVAAPQEYVNTFSTRRVINTPREITAVGFFCVFPTYFLGHRCVSSSSGSSTRMLSFLIFLLQLRNGARVHKKQRNEALPLAHAQTILYTSN